MITPIQSIKPLWDRRFHFYEKPFIWLSQYVVPIVVNNLSSISLFISNSLIHLIKDEVTQFFATPFAFYSSRYVFFLLTSSANLYVFLLFLLFYVNFFAIFCPYSLFLFVFIYFFVVNCQCTVGIRGLTSPTLESFASTDRYGQTFIVPASSPTTTLTSVSSL